jgi:hypothetical protein
MLYASRSANAPVKLVDFGISAKVGHSSADGAESTAPVGMVVGTTCYTSPVREDDRYTSS